VGATTVTIPYTINETVNAPLTGYNTVAADLAPNAANGAIIAQGLGQSLSTNNTAYWDFHYAGSGSTNNHGCVDIYGINCIAAWYPGDYFGVDALVGTGHTPTVTFATGSGSISTGSTNTAGSILISSAGAFDFTVGMLTQSGGTISAPHYFNCSFNNTAQNSDTVKMVGSSPSGVEGWGTTTAADEYVTYVCAAF
jgi:hypothetical protein